MGLRLDLGPYLASRGLSAYRVVKETAGRVSPNTVYDLARKPARRVDLETVSEVMSALERITGEPVDIKDLLVKDAGAIEPGPDASTRQPDLGARVARMREHALSSRLPAPRRAGPIGQAEPVELEGDGLPTSEVVVQMRRGEW